MMQRIALLLLVILVELCVAQTGCGSTKKACFKNGGDCQPKNTKCVGTSFQGKKYCKKWKNCFCCVPPPDCSTGTLPPCRLMNGTCMGQDEPCNSRVITDKAFCNYGDACKCCIPDCFCHPGTCTHNDQDGRCLRYQLIGTIGVGPQDCKDGCQCYIEDNNSCPKPNCTAFYENQLYDGICRVDDCLPMEKRADFCPNSSCNCCINVTEVCDPERCSFKDKYRGDCLREIPKNTVCVGNQECNDGCNCYINDTVCGPACTTVSPYCICTDGPCPEGFCFHDVGLCKGCSCCQISDCKPKNTRCTDPGDFCVDKFLNSADICRKGFAKVFDSCFKNATTDPATSVDCDCCKSLACRPNGDRCSGKGAYCTDRLAVCPKGYHTSEDCSKPVVVNGVWIASKLCKCCTPLEIEIV